MNPGYKQRNSNLEMLRIISMLLIVIYHYAQHGFVEEQLTYSMNKYIVNGLASVGKLGVDIFVLISGYYMVESHFSAKKLLKIVGQVWFYSVLFLLVFLPGGGIGKSLILQNLMPVTYSMYWFVTTFIIMMLLSPFMNQLIHTMTRKEYRKLIGILLVIWSFLPVFFCAMFGFNEVIWFMVLYLIAGYIRRYSDVGRKNAKKHLFVAGVFFLLLLVSVFCFNWFGHMLHLQSFLNNSRHFASLNSIIVLVIAVEVLIGFLHMERRTNPWINGMATATFGVYLIHDNYFVSPFLWNTILHTEKMFTSPWLLLHAAGATAGIYLICSVLDLIRQKTVERIYLKMLDRYLGSIIIKCKAIVRKLFTKSKGILDHYYSS